MEPTADGVLSGVLMSLSTSLGKQLSVSVPLAHEHDPVGVAITNGRLAAVVAASLSVMKPPVFAGHVHARVVMVVSA